MGDGGVPDGGAADGGVALCVERAGLFSCAVAPARSTGVTAPGALAAAGLAALWLVAARRRAARHG
jgi:hypothetical protein